MTKSSSIHSIRRFPQSVYPKKSNIWLADQTVAKGLALPVPTISDAEPWIGSLILPRIYGDFLHVHKEIEVEITEGGRDELVPKLSKNHLAMVFLSHDEPLEPAQHFC